MRSLKLPWRVKSLKRLSLVCIAKGIRFWMEDMPEDCDGYQYILSPFEILGSALTQEILDTLVELEKFKAPVLHLLLHPSTVSLDLSNCLKLHNVGDTSLKIMYKRCRKLRRLNLLGRTRLCAINMLHRLPTSEFGRCLVDLRITHDSLSDTFMQLLSGNCTSLLCLHVNSCRKLTEQGFLELTKFKDLEELRLGVNHFPNFTDKILAHLCKTLLKLKTLFISMARVNLHSLLKEDKSTLCRLRRVTLECTNADDLSIDIITSLFDNIRELSVSHSSNVTKKSLHFLKRCKLYKLELSDTGIDEYVPELDELLKLYGVHLHHLRLSCVSGINLAQVATQCSFLESLTLCQCRNLKTPWISTELAASNGYKRRLNGCMNTSSVSELCPDLKTLFLDCVDLNEQEEEGLELEAILRGASSMTSLSLVGVSMLTDERLQQLLETFDCKSIKHLDVSQNRYVTVDGIYHVLAKCDNLMTLQVTKCDIVRHEFTELVKLVDAHRADVVLNNIEFW